jgi:bis(5'-nucleosyl)-tetraphosphatase (symmetrical)
MSTYLLGDIQACEGAFRRLMETLDFSPSRDVLYVLGDMVNRGTGSLGVLRQLRAWEGSAVCILGNHDIHLLSVLAGQQRLREEDTFGDVLAATDAQVLFDWLRHRPLAHALEHGGHQYLLVHAGVLPAWDKDQTLSLAQEVQEALQGMQAKCFLGALYGNWPRIWNEKWAGMDRLRVITNVLTRLRFCTGMGEMDFVHKMQTPPSSCYRPWFEWEHRQTAVEGLTLAFGHWSSLGLMEKPGLLGLDTGCVWGQALTAARLTASKGEYELIHIPCSRPGGDGGPN